MDRESNRNIELATKYAKPIPNSASGSSYMSIEREKLNKYFESKKSFQKETYK